MITVEKVSWKTAKQWEKEAYNQGISDAIKICENEINQIYDGGEDIVLTHAIERINNIKSKLSALKTNPEEKK